jgi:hypothetical protein
MATKRPSLLTGGWTHRPQNAARTTAGSAEAARGAPARESESSAATAQRLTNSQIAERAMAIWRARGCPAGHDVEIWLEAERQLKHGMGSA